MKINKVAVVCKGGEEAVCELVKQKGFEVLCLPKENLCGEKLRDADLVISVGGDGTVLSAAHFLNDKPILAVNSNPTKSEGALTTINICDLEKKLDEIKNGKYSAEKLERIEVEINGFPQETTALNEIFIANEKAYRVSRYKIKFGAVEEEQKSSGLIFATGTGSTAWFKSAGGEQFSPQAKFIKMIVREPYLGKLFRFSLCDAVIKENESFEVVPRTDAVLVIDSIREIKLNDGDKIFVRISERPLMRIL